MLIWPLYVPAKGSQQGVRRNSARFPETSPFLLTPEEKAEWSQIVTTSAVEVLPVSPRAFTEHGALMAPTF